MKLRALLLLLTCTACEGGLSGAPVKIGAILSLTGGLASNPSSDANAINLAIEEINLAGGVHGEKLDIEVLDDQSTSATAATHAQTMASEQLPVVLGGYTSNITLAAAAVTAPAGVVQISGSATSPALTSFDDKAGFLFRTVPSEGLIGQAIAKRARAHAPVFSKAAVIYVPRAFYGQGIAEAFAADFTKAGGTVTAKLPYEEGAVDYSALLGKVFEGSPETVVLIAAPTDGAAIVDAYLTSSYSSRAVTWYFGNLLVSNTFRTTLGDARFGFPHELVDISPPSTPRYETFKQAFKVRYQRDPDGDAHHWYDAVYVAALGLQTVGSGTGEALQKAMMRASSGGTVVGPGDYRTAAADAAAGKDVDYDGASGSIDFDERGDVPGSCDAWKVDPAGTGFQLVQGRILQ